MVNLTHPAAHSEVERLIWNLTGTATALERILYDRLMMTGQINPHHRVYLSMTSQAPSAKICWPEFRLKIQREGGDHDYVKLTPFDIQGLADGELTLTTLKMLGNR